MVSKKFIIYLIRWQISAAVIAPFMWALTEFTTLGQFTILSIIQFVGSLIFYKIDNWIFREKQSNTKKKRMRYITDADEADRAIMARFDKWDRNAWRLDALIAKMEAWDKENKEKT